MCFFSPQNKVVFSVVMVFSFFVLVKNEGMNEPHDGRGNEGVDAEEETYRILENVTLMPYVEELLSLLRTQQNPNPGFMGTEVGPHPDLSTAVNDVLDKLAADMRRLADFASPYNTPGAQYSSLAEQQSVIHELEEKHAALDRDIERYRAMLADILASASSQSVPPPDDSAPHSDAM